ncbi:MAG TPA: hypothetical protein VFC24_09820 [Casimicrobiaceae bacterium]|nr:hypothetical protein [Casimicrobiaceae bacterium]
MTEYVTARTMELFSDMTGAAIRKFFDQEMAKRDARIIELEHKVAELQQQRSTDGDTK